MAATAEALEVRLPRWVRVLDGVAVLLLCLAVVLTVGDGVRFDLGRLRISISSALRVAVWAAIVVGARHILYRRPALPTRVWVWIRRDAVRSDLPFVARVLMTTRLPVLAVGLLAVAAIGIETDLGYKRYDNPLLDLVGRWDALRYADIARFGYEWDGNPARQQLVVFFPAFPLAAHIVGRFLDVDALAATWLVSMAAFAWAMLLLVELARLSIGRAGAMDSVWLLAAYPFAVYFSAPYTESLFLLSMCGAFLAAHQLRLGHVAAWGIVAGLTRPNGWLLAAPLAILLFHAAGRPSTIREWLKRGLAALAPFAGTVLFTLYLQLVFSDGLAWVKGQAAWNRTFRGLHLFFADRILYIRDLGLLQYLIDLPIDALNTAAAVFALALMIPVSRRLGLAYGALVGVLVLPPLLMGGSTSMGRMTSVLFPIFMWLAAVLTPERRTATLIVFGILQGLTATLFFTWRDLY
jgi:hypothetical protein